MENVSEAWCAKQTRLVGAMDLSTGQEVDAEMTLVGGGTQQTHANSRIDFFTAELYAQWVVKLKADLGPAVSFDMDPRYTPSTDGRFAPRVIVNGKPVKMGTLREQLAEGKSPSGDIVWDYREYTLGVDVMPARFTNPAHGVIAYEPVRIQPTATPLEGPASGPPKPGYEWKRVSLGGWEQVPIAGGAIPEDMIARIVALLRKG